VTELRRDDVPVENLTDDHFRGVLDLVASGDLAQEGVPDLLTGLAENPDREPAELAEELGLGSAGEDEVRDAVSEVVEQNSEQVEAEGWGRSPR